jgi:hypothetical protein
MVRVAESYARFERTIQAGVVDDAARRLLRFAEAVVVSNYQESFRGVEFEVLVRVERGSTKVRIAVLVATLTLFERILTDYGSYRQGLDYMVRDGKAAANFIIAHLPEQLHFSEPPQSKRTSVGAIGELQKLFVAVERHEMSSDQATKFAVDVLYKESPEVLEEAPAVTQHLAKEFRQLEVSTSESIRVSDAVTAQLVPARKKKPPVKRRLPVTRQPAIVQRRPRVKRSGVIAFRDKNGKLTLRPY